MKQFKFTFLYVLFFAVCGFITASAQNGNTVISAINAWDNGDGTGTVEVRISGRDADLAESFIMQMTGSRVGGFCVLSGTIKSRVSTGPSNHTTILSATVPIFPSKENGPDFVDIALKVPIKPGPLSPGGYFLNYDNKVGEFFKK